MLVVGNRRRWRGDGGWSKQEYSLNCPTKLAVVETPRSRPVHTPPGPGEVVGRGEGESVGVGDSISFCLQTPRSYCPGQPLTFVT